MACFFSFPSIQYFRSGPDIAVVISCMRCVTLRFGIPMVFQFSEPLHYAHQSLSNTAHKMPLVVQENTPSRVVWAKKSLAGIRRRDQTLKRMPTPNACKCSLGPAPTDKMRFLLIQYIYGVGSSITFGRSRKPHWFDQGVGQQLVANGIVYVYFHTVIYKLVIMIH